MWGCVYGGVIGFLIELSHWNVCVCVCVRGVFDVCGAAGSGMSARRGAVSLMFAVWRVLECRRGGRCL